MSCLLDNIRAIKGTFDKHAQRHGGKVSLCRREMKRLIREEFAEVIENPHDPQTLELMFQLLDINGDCLVEFNEYLILIFRTAMACCCRLESEKCGEICRAPCERELQEDRKDCHQLRSSERKGEHVGERQGEPEGRADEWSHQACDLDLRDALGEARPSCKTEVWEDICECRKCGSQRQSEVARDLEPQKDKATPCHLLGEYGQGPQQYYDMKDVEGESVRRRVQLITAELRDDKRKRCHGHERRASDDGQRKPQDCEPELLGSQRRSWSPVRGRLLRRGGAQYYEPEPLEKDADLRRTRGCEPTWREVAQKQGRYCTSLERDFDQECDAEPREVKRRRTQLCRPELREKVERDQQYCGCEPLGKESDRRRPQGCGVSLRKDAQKQRCDPESLERDARKKTSQARTPRLCEDSQRHGEVGGLERGEKRRRSVRRKVTGQEDILGRQESYETGSLETDGDEKKRRPQVCEPGLRECVPKNQLCGDPQPWKESVTGEGSGLRRRGGEKLHHTELWSLKIYPNLSKAAHAFPLSYTTGDSIYRQNWLQYSQASEITDRALPQHRLSFLKERK